MPKQNQPDPRTNFVPRYLPWLIGALMMMVYCVTLNHWVTLLNIFQVAIVSGWLWQPQLYNPVTFLATLPFRLLPAAHVPIILNLLAALFGAATLVVLARSVAILPHDRTEMERTRERSDFSFLTGWVAWLPPIVAVLFCGLEFGFWENATNFSGESLQILFFAVILWQMLEYRLDEKVGRLYLAAFLYGVGMTENWAMIGFFPAFITMMIWLRKVEFFDVHFLLRTTLSGLSGLLFFLLLPLVAKATTLYPVTFWEALRPNLHTDWQFIHLVTVSDFRYDLALISLTTLLPALVMSVRWSATFGDSSRTGSTIVNYLMHVVAFVFFGALVWIMFDPPFSPRQLAQSVLPNVPALTFYYIAALSLGYYLGYALLVFGRSALPSRRYPRPLRALPSGLAWLCPIIVVGTLLGTAIATGLLLYKNIPDIRAVNGDAFSKYAQLTVDKLPHDRAVVLCDSDDPAQDQPLRAFVIQAALAREGLDKKLAVVDTKSLDYTAYHKFLHREFPAIWPVSVSTNQFGVNPLQIFLLLNQLSKSNTLCYLNPSYGYYFELFYQEPHGLVYTLKPYPDGQLLPPALPPGVIAENQTFWDQALSTVRPAIQRAQNPVNFAAMHNPVGWIMRHLHAPDETDPNALMAGQFYSRGLNYMGVQVERQGQLDAAANYFREARSLNTNNVVARINLDFNKTLKAGQPTEVSLSRVTADQFGKYRNWNEVLNANGPFDETSFCFENGAMLMQSTPPLLHQAADSFNRVYQLAPDNLPARLFLARIYVLSRMPDQALQVLQDPLADPKRFALNDFNSTELHVLAATADFQKGDNPPAVRYFEQEIDRHPDDQDLLLAAAQFFNMHGLYTNSLRVIDRKLARSPNDPQWIYGKGIVSLQIGAYDDAVNALTHFLELATNNPDALYNRGFANLKAGHLEAARTDFEKLQAAYTNNFQVAYGLGEIAWQKHDTNEAIRNYHIFLTGAPTNAVEVKTVRDRLTQLGAK